MSVYRAPLFIGRRGRGLLDL